MAMRGIRGAIVAPTNTSEGILGAARDLVLAIQTANPQLQAQDIASVFFTLTADLDAAFPAYAARELGWDGVPFLCAREIPVPGALGSCVRVLIHWNTDLPQDAIRHVYLGAAAALRPDLFPRGAGG
jgi:chorismate mutase